MAKPASISPSSRSVLLFLLTVDALFVVLHINLIFTGWLQDPRFSLELDRGFSEWYQYAKTAAAGAVLLVLARRHRDLALTLWVAVFAYIVLDDSLRFHEEAGHLSERWLGTDQIVFLPARDVGQLVFAAAIGAMFVPCLIYGHLKTTNPAREVSRALFLLGAAFVTCIVGMDILHSGLKTRTIETPWLLMEEAGELVVMSITLSYLWRSVTDTRSALD